MCIKVRVVEDHLDENGTQVIDRAEPISYSLVADDHEPHYDPEGFLHMTLPPQISEKPTTCEWCRKASQIGTSLPQTAARFHGRCLGDCDCAYHSSDE